MTEEVFKMDLIIPTFFITILFAFSLLIAFIIRKILIEKFAKPLYYVGFIFFLLLPIFVIFQGYQEYKEYHFLKIILILQLLLAHLYYIDLVFP